MEEGGDTSFLDDDGDAMGKDGGHGGSVGCLCDMAIPA